MIPQFTLPLVPTISPPQPPPSLLDRLIPNMSWSTRIMGFASCTVIGILLNVISIGSIFKLMTGNPTKFAIIYSLGNAFELLSTTFLVGVRQQLKNMTDPKRRWPALIFVSAMVCTMCVICINKSLKLAIIIGLLTQWAALLWYSLSYIPYAQTIARRVLSHVVNQ